MAVHQLGRDPGGVDDAVVERPRQPLLGNLVAGPAVELDQVDLDLPRLDLCAQVGERSDGALLDLDAERRGRRLVEGLAQRLLIGAAVGGDDQRLLGLRECGLPKHERGREYGVDRSVHLPPQASTSHAAIAHQHWQPRPPNRNEPAQKIRPLAVPRF